jgi:hypothetical protein
MEKLLSDDEVMKLAGQDSKVVTYPEIEEYDSLPHLFGNKNKVIILYLNEKTPTSVIGHWVLLTRQRRNGKEIIEFNDSYGGEIDSQLDYHSDAKNRKLGQDGGYLSRLLYDHCNGRPDKEIHYNEAGFQKEKPNVNTCGRWVGVRSHFYKIPLEKWQSTWKKMKKDGYDLDKTITALSNKLLQ